MGRVPAARSSSPSTKYAQSCRRAPRTPGRPLQAATDSSGLCVRACACMWHAHGRTRNTVAVCVCVCVCTKPHVIMLCACAHTPLIDYGVFYGECDRRWHGSIPSVRAPVGDDIIHASEHTFHCDAIIDVICISLWSCDSRWANSRTGFTTTSTTTTKTAHTQIQSHLVHLESGDPERAFVYPLCISNGIRTNQQEEKNNKKPNTNNKSHTLANDHHRNFVQNKPVSLLAKECARTYHKTNTNRPARRYRRHTRTHTYMV